uniref:Uncharacterized protein n=1 Tax=Heterorhabditis bacteriophora TaxID=37862 RepID=A0A1I7X5H3_HETBA
MISPCERVIVSWKDFSKYQSTSTEVRLLQQLFFILLQTPTTFTMYLKDSALTVVVNSIQ